MSAPVCPHGLCDGSGTFDDGPVTGHCRCLHERLAAPAAVTPPDPWALLALRRAERAAAERIYEAARAERARTWQARLDARIAADASGIPRPT